METIKKSRPPKPEGMPWLIPYITVHNVTDAMDFYEKAFGFEKAMTMTDKEYITSHGEMKYQNIIIFMIGSEGAPGTECKSPATSQGICPINLYIYCPDVDELFNRAKKAGAAVISKPEDMFWGDRITQLEDPDGYRWTFATNVADFDLANAPK